VGGCLFAFALTVQRYSKPANWTVINELANAHHSVVPVVGNGDILTWYEADDRMNGGRIDPTGPANALGFNDLEGSPCKGVL
jgi:tRNA-dihydrouridine synthase